MRNAFVITVVALSLCFGIRAQAATALAALASTEPVFESLEFEKTHFELQFATGMDDAARGEIKRWIPRSARVIADYLGQFPVPAVTILIVSVEGAAVNSGSTFSDPELRIRVRVGRNATRETFLTDWIMVHEMVHLAIPQIPRSQNWFHEGAATYVEIIARARAGLSGANGGWLELMRNMAQGQPKADDKGLDHTPTWGRTYWGGAMFCLLADIEIHKRTGNRLGLADALRGIIAKGGNYTQRWPLEQTLTVGDAATASTVLNEMHARMKDTPSPTDLAALWRDLGVSEVDGALVLRDDARLSATRRAILGPRAQLVQAP